jgi:hypothetical protein
MNVTQDKQKSCPIAANGCDGIFCRQTGPTVAKVSQCSSSSSSSTSAQGFATGPLHYYRADSDSGCIMPHQHQVQKICLSLQTVASIGSGVHVRGRCLGVMSGLR